MEGGGVGDFGGVGGGECLRVDEFISLRPRFGLEML